MDDQMKPKAQGPMLDPEKVKQFQKGFFKDRADAGDAMSRRMNQLNQQDPNLAVNNALGALAQLPPDYQKEYAPTLIKTQMMLEKKGGMA